MMAPEMRLHNLSPGTWHVNLIGKKTFADVMKLKIMRRWSPCFIQVDTQGRDSWKEEEADEDAGRDQS